MDITGYINKAGIKVIKFPAKNNMRRIASIGKKSGIMMYEEYKNDEWIYHHSESLNEAQIKGIKIANKGGKYEDAV